MQYLESVDNSLRLLLMVARETRVGVTEAAHELGVAPSTAYRILATMRYRGFVVKAKGRTYQAGPAFTVLIRSQASRMSLSEVARPLMEDLRDVTDETCHLSVLTGSQARVLASVESEQVLRIGMRTGAHFPAHLHAGGKVLLAELPEPELEELYPAAGVPEYALTPNRLKDLRRELTRVREDGFAVNIGQTDRGVAAVAVVIRDELGAVGALSVSVPTVRFAPANIPELVAHLRRTADAISEDLKY